MSKIATTKFFIRGDENAGETMVGADAIMTIKGYPQATFNIKTFTLPQLKSEEIEYSTPHGVKSGQQGYLQTYQTITVTMMERAGLGTINMLNEILLEEKKINVSFYTGRTIEQSIEWASSNQNASATMTGCSVIVEEGAEADSESTTAPLSISFTIKGHYFPTSQHSAAKDITDIL